MQRRKTRHAPEPRPHVLADMPQIDRKRPRIQFPRCAEMFDCIVQMPAAPRSFLQRIFRRCQRFFLDDVPRSAPELVHTRRRPTKARLNIGIIALYCSSTSRSTNRTLTTPSVLTFTGWGTPPYFASQSGSI